MTMKMKIFYLRGSKKPEGNDDDNVLFTEREKEKNYKNDKQTISLTNFLFQKREERIAMTNTILYLKKRENDNENDIDDSNDDTDNSSFTREGVDDNDDGNFLYKWEGEREKKKTVPKTKTILYLPRSEKE